ncbi:MAG: S41 family peptidase [Holophagae bacterium]
MIRTKSFVLTIVTLIVALGALPAAAQTKLLRFPDIHGEQVVFCYGGDLWKAPADGGVAVRLTAHPGQELFPKFSPDGNWIAFTGQYDGDEQVYVMPAEGGAPKQLTYYPAVGPLPPRWGYDHQVYGWTPDGSAVLFRGLRDTDGVEVQTALYTIDVDGGLPVKLPMPTSGAGDFSPDGSKMVYSPLFRDFRTWKRYQGGWAQDLLIFDLDTAETEEVAPSVRTERDPMWIGDTIYFASDRDGTLNLYARAAAGGDVRQITDSTTWDVRWPSSDNRSRIVYQLAGELHVYDTASDTDTKISIRVPDDGLASRPSRYPAYDNIEDFELSPKGERALFVARGDIFTVPIEKGPTRNLTRSSGAHDKHARWSPDGAKIAFISDASGEEQVYLVAQDGSGEPEQLTDSFRAMLYAPEWAPDGKRLALSDKNGKLYVVAVDSRSVQEIADDPRGRIFDYAWSPNGGHLAFSMAGENNLDSLYIWSVADGTTRRITGGMTNEYGPSWDPEGNYLFYLSEREYAPQISLLEWNIAGNRMTGIFALALREDVKDPFAPESDEVTLDGDEESDDTRDADAKTKDKGAKDDDEQKKAKAKEYLKIDFDGLAERAVRVPVEASNYGGLVAVEGHLLYSDRGAPFYGRRSPDKPALHIFDMKEREDSTLTEGLDGYAVSADGSKVLVQQNSSYLLYDAKPKASDPKNVSTSDMMVDRVPAEEWAQIFDEVWRRYRDFFYVDNMHGYDWQAIGEQYRQLVPYVAHRSDLTYVISEMIAELSVGHAYIQGGDYEIPPRPRVALPGARFEADAESGRYRIAEIYRGHNQEPKYRSPLTEVGIDASPGLYVLAINGQDLTTGDNPYRLLQHVTDPVTLTVNDSPELDGSREITYDPIYSEASLRYLDWVLDNMAYVDEATGGRVGYMHIPDMGGDGIAEFIKWFYPQIRKEGLIVDVRSNGGGNVSQIILERLDNTLLGTRFGTFSDQPGTYPQVVFHGHMVCLISETSASDGDIFPYYFREAGLGPLIGKRTWGGVVGISGTGTLIDGGTVFVPLNGSNSPTGEWIMEGRGVEPDIEVENDPRSIIEGHDPQLERGIAEVLQRMEANPMKLPERPPAPIKTK